MSNKTEAEARFEVKSYDEDSSSKMENYIQISSSNHYKRNNNVRN